jgi:hypothetical protein
MLLSSPSIIVAYLWIWAVGDIANAKLDERLQRKTTLLKIAIPYAALYLFFAIWAWPNSIMAEEPTIPVGFLLTAHMSAVLLLFYSIIFSARSISSIGKANLSGFGRTTLFVLALLYYPIGVWFIQPRLNALVD